ncbi:hypothetical protein RB7799 [Rhodopirellula baltica SH 1]|uniref:Uncharacterized protein n=1 Tax=Rhodopirellula baltica (strain DSM 10527 / NCIMB 13988 / SH1) TaxID=243090 RepID=Q7UN40_RHOBA|nr:hypothetical protein RB7799 [Rhodopirellula baltica SH 1]
MLLRCWKWGNTDLLSSHTNGCKLGRITPGISVRSAFLKQSSSGRLWPTPSLAFGSLFEVV